MVSLARSIACFTVVSHPASAMRHTATVLDSLVILTCLAPADRRLFFAAVPPARASLGFVADLSLVHAIAVAVVVTATTHFAAVLLALRPITITHMAALSTLLIILS